MIFFETEEERKKRIEKEKFELQLQTNMKIRELERELAKNDKEAADAYSKAEAYKAAGNKDSAIDSYQDYLFARSLRRTLNKSVKMMKQVTTMVKAGNLTNEVFSLLKTRLESSDFDPSAIQEIITGNERLKSAFEAMGATMDAYSEAPGDEANAEAWFNSGSTAETSAPGSTDSLDKMMAEFEKLKKG